MPRWCHQQYLIRCRLLQSLGTMSAASPMWIAFWSTPLSKLRVYVQCYTRAFRCKPPWLPSVPFCHWGHNLCGPFCHHGLGGAGEGFSLGSWESSSDYVATHARNSNFDEPYSPTFDGELVPFLVVKHFKGFVLEHELLHHRLDWNLTRLPYWIMRFGINNLIASCASGQWACLEGYQWNPNWVWVMRDLTLIWICFLLNIWF